MTEPTCAVWKYELQPDVTVLDLPVGASALMTAAQGQGVFLWALVIAGRDQREGYGPIPTEKRAFLTVGTGHKYHPAMFGRYIGTAFVDGLVFHTFETAVPDPSTETPAIYFLEGEVR